MKFSKIGNWKGGGLGVPQAALGNRRKAERNDGLRMREPAKIINSNTDCISRFI